MNNGSPEIIVWSDVVSIAEVNIATVVLKSPTIKNDLCHSLRFLEGGGQ